MLSPKRRKMLYSSVTTSLPVRFLYNTVCCRNASFQSWLQFKAEQLLYTVCWYTCHIVTAVFSTYVQFFMQFLCVIVDWMIANMLAIRQGSIGRIRYVLKDSLKYLPFYGAYFRQVS